MNIYYDARFMYTALYGTQLSTYFDTNSIYTKYTSSAPTSNTFVQIYKKYLRLRRDLVGIFSTYP